MNTEILLKSAVRGERKTDLHPSTIPNSTATGASFPSAPLAQAVSAAIHVVPDSRLRRVASLGAGPAFQPRALLALLVYCYAREVYSSHEIEALMMRDRPFRQFCEDEFPGTRVIRRFRQTNRNAIHECLVEVFRFLELRSRDSKDRLGDDAAERCRDQEAYSRIEKAIFIDMMESDED